MPFQIIRNDITKMRVDAIVNPAKTSLLGGGGTDGAIHAAAGPGLLEECRGLGGCGVGQAKITAAYNLPCSYVIHTVGPKWRGGLLGEVRKLESCYRTCLELAMENNCKTVAFPLISSGAYGFPKDKAMKAAMDVIGEFLLEHEMTVYLVVFGQDSVALGRRLFADIQEYIDDNYVQEHEPPYARRRQRLEESGILCGAPAENGEFSLSACPMPAAFAQPQPKEGRVFLDGLLDEIDESFQQMLLRKIDESGMTDSQCYKKANIDRKLFSKIRNDIHYKPSKSTALAFAIALELDMEETEELLRKAGFALSRSSKFDIIIQFFIQRRSYNIFEINETLFYYDQSLLGSI